MIDRLDLRIPKDAVWRPAVEKIFSYDPLIPFSARVRSAKHYERKTDLREVGFDAILHVKCRRGGKNSKLEILDVGKKPYSEIVRLIESVANVKVDQLGVMRIDLTADIPSVTVPWFKSHVRFKYKRTDREYGQLQYGLVGHGEVETIISGSRPNVYRVYNKTKECEVQFKRMLRRVSPDAAPLDFESEFGLKETDILTRFDCQCGGRIPPEISTFGHLQNLLEFNPFPHVEITSSQQRSLPTHKNAKDLITTPGSGCIYKLAD